MNLPSRKELISNAVKSGKLPSLPSVAMEIVRLCKSDDVPLDKLAHVVSIDPSLAAKILRLANTAKYRRNQELTDLHRACFVLGLKTLKIMSLGFSVAEAAERPDSDCCFDYDAYWANSISCAVAARELAKMVEPDWENEAFFCGLLGRVGQLAMARAIPEDYDDIIDASRTLLPTSEDELAAFGFDHHELAEQLLSLWELPELLVSAVTYWNQPDNGGEAKRICQIVRLADRISRLIHEREKGDHLRQAYMMAETDFGISQAELDDLIVILNEEINSLARILDVKIENQSEYQQLVDDAREQMAQISLQAAMELETTSIDLEHERERSSRLESRSEELLKKSQMDSLTGVANRGAFDSKLRKLIAAKIADSNSKGIGVLMLDVDHFKVVNDTYGHLVGDRVLKEVATAVKNSLRPSDFMARYGGEEFVILFAQTGLHELKNVAERTRKVVEDVIIMHEGKAFGVTASLGGAICREFNEISDGIELIKLADECLYNAKKAGRNRCSFTEFAPVNTR
ncbi:MAG: HDOD domain-containing protein [Planctomycetota bacterium]|nr:HDOD domain-containing protein [Planctomycetota bacterium]